MLGLLRRTVDEFGQTIVMVTHDPVAAAYTDRVVFLGDGRVVDEMREPTRERVLEQMARARRASRRRPPPTGSRLMLHAAWRSLLGRKVRLVMSAFAIVLGVAFVVGTLIFTDTLNRSFVAIFDNSVGDVVVSRPG